VREDPRRGSVFFRYLCFRIQRSAADEVPGRRSEDEDEERNSDAAAD